MRRGKARECTFDCTSGNIDRDVYRRVLGAAA